MERNICLKYLLLQSIKVNYIRAQWCAIKRNGILHLLQEVCIEVDGRNIVEIITI